MGIFKVHHEEFYKKNIIWYKCTFTNKEIYDVSLFMLNNEIFSANFLLTRQGFLAHKNFLFNSVRSVKSVIWLFSSIFKFKNFFIDQ